MLKKANGDDEDEQRSYNRKTGNGAMEVLSAFIWKHCFSAVIQYCGQSGGREICW